MKYKENKNMVVKNKNSIKKFYYDRANEYEEESQQYYELKLVTAMSLYYQDIRFLQFCWHNREDGTHDEFLKYDKENDGKSLTNWAMSYRGDGWEADWRKFKYFTFNEQLAHQIEIEQVQEVEETKRKIGFY